MELYHYIAGLILLLFGRKLFWLFVAVAGFLVGMELAGLFLMHHAAWIRLLAAVGAGVLGATAALFAQRVAFAFAGFYAGAFLVLIPTGLFGFSFNPLPFIVAGGVVGAVLAVLFMDRAIIVLSCLVGAGTIVQALGAGPIMRMILFIILVVAGVFAQTRLFTPSKEK